LKNKILIIARAFPPMGGGGVQRIVKFSIYLAELGWDITVCAPSLENASWIDESRYKELKSIKIIRIKEKEINKGLTGKISRKLKVFDSFSSWAHKVQDYFSKSNNFEYDYILTSGPPHSIHKIGLELKRKYNCIWVSDFRDHYTLGPGYNALTKLHAKIEKTFEQNIYTHSDLIITNTDTNRNDILKKFKVETVSKIVSIYNGYDFNDLKVTEEAPDFDENKINLIYLGGLRGDSIDGYFYRMLKLAYDKDRNLINGIKINMIGDLTRKGKLIETLKIEHLFKNFDAIAFDKVGDFIKSADGCLTWQNPNEAYKGTIAGKVFDYIGLKKPIFSLGQPNSELDIIINNNKMGIHSDVSKLEHAADDFIKFVKNLKLYDKSYDEMDEEFYNSFNRKNQVNELNRLLNKIAR
jgi:glycosyltransferase involved in cell wall biosynthesis